METINLIDKKRKKERLNKEEINFIINAYVKKEMPDYQMSALLMAISINGMNWEETFNLTNAMKNSGKVFKLNNQKGKIFDKHSTGGVGDNVTLITGPIIASFGLKFAKMSGKGLGYTGGTIDKLKSIKNFNVHLNDIDFKKQIEKHQIAIISQDIDIVPADKYIYALRDVTATVSSIPLIASSIMSKKIATGVDNIFIDIKCGNGAFLEKLDDCILLAQCIQKIGESFKKNIIIEVTNMSRPLGRAIGNKIEILEIINFFKNDNVPNDLKEVVYSCCIKILLKARIFNNKEKARKAIIDKINSGVAFNKLKEWIESQNGDWDDLISPNFFNPQYKCEIKASSNGYVNINSALKIGQLALYLGGGRKFKNDEIDYDAGVFINKKTNQKVIKNDVVMTLYSSKPITKHIKLLAKESFEIIETKIQNQMILYEMT